MKARNIISAILMVLSFAACTSEIEGIDNNMTNIGNTNGTTSISVCMMTNGIDTKATGEDNSLTLEEKTINNYLVAVFEHESKERVGYVKGKNQQTGGEVIGLNLSVDCKEGLVDVYVVANLDETDEAKFDAIYTSTEFKKQSVNSLCNLVKVGSVIGKEISVNNTNVTIELSQLTARVLVNVKSVASVNGDDSGKGSITAEVKTISYKAKVENTSKLIEPEAGAGVTPEKAITPETNNFHFDTYKLNDPTLVLNVEIVVSTTDKSVTLEREITVPFKQLEGSPLSVLENGKSYRLDINASISVSVNCEVMLDYTLHEIKEINQNIEFE